ncbi:MAG TPA: hypothetical protein VIK31_03295 [Propionibacteriaceae bacterium]
MLTYPIPGSTLTGNATLAQALAFLKSPTQIARRFNEILSDHNFLAHYLLRGQYKMQGGAISIANEGTSTGGTSETVAPGGEYPMLALPADSATLIAALKKGLATEVTDEEVGRLIQDPTERAIQLLAFQLVSDFDSVSLSAIATAITQAVACSAFTAGANIITGVETAKATLKGLKKGYRATSVVLTGIQWAAIAAPLIAVLPREAGNPLTSGGVPNILDLDWVTSDDLPSGWLPTVVDANNLGGIGHEDIPSPEYVSLFSVSDTNQPNRSNVEVARFREKNDSTKIQVRKADVPVVRNADAGVELTGTGL